MSIGNNMFRALKMRYESEIQESKTTMLIYLTNPVGIGEHPQHLEEMDKLLEKISTAMDKLNALQTHFNQYDPQNTLLQSNINILPT